MVADLSKLLSLSHPSQNDFEVRFSIRSSKSNLLDSFPGVVDGDRTVLLEDVEDHSGYRLRLLRRRSELDWFHFRLRFSSTKT